ncbi:hypothetical protein H4R34_005644 [Dimargaris verticillata]|uniref:Kinase n=1 Tax=Dimargaris verticillata TaxID=2761393 RepID=A0A9W8E6Y7_9FUNG|nr:hypothetical protein H4R34_005644 [Dimargaris verticillata]
MIAGSDCRLHAPTRPTRDPFSTEARPMEPRPLEHQVAGHDGVMTVDGGELIVKPCSETEKDFYEQTVAHPEFQLFMPHYFGMLNLSEDQSFAQDMLIDNSEHDHTMTTHGTASEAPIPPSSHPPAPGADLTATQELSVQRAVCIENLLYGFSKPCIMDVKMGTRLYDDNATEAKRNHMIAKANESTSGSLGICIAGIKVFDEVQKEYIQYDRSFGYQLTDDTIDKGFCAFLPRHMNSGYREFLLKEFTLVLKEMCQMVKSQNVRLYGTSLLFVYEGDAERRERILAEDNDDKSDEDIDNGESEAQPTVKPQDPSPQSTRPDSSQLVDSSVASDPETEMSMEDDDSDDEDDENDKMLYDLRIIDFSHASWSPGLGRDEGFLVGLKNVQAILQRIL